MHLKNLACRLCIVLTAVVVFPSVTIGADQQQDKLADSLTQHLNSGSGGELVRVIIHVNGDVDRTDLAFKKEPGKTLKAHSKKSQKEILKYLKALKVGKDRSEVVDSLWLSNAIVAEVAPWVIPVLSARTDVVKLYHDKKQDTLQMAKSAQAQSTTTSCALTQVNAPQTWNMLNYDGSGTVIALIDTGVAMHTDIANHLWVNTGEIPTNSQDDDLNGFVDDVNGWNFQYGNTDLTDPVGHGTEVAGILVGDGSSGIETGVAPGAKLMVLRIGSVPYESRIWQAMQYAVDNGADVINLSYGWNPNQFPSRALWRQNIDNVVAMGVPFVAPAGNEATNFPPASSITTPGDVPSAITVGATHCNRLSYLATSNGPTTWQNVSPYFDFPYPPGLVKPDLSAPGAAIATTEWHWSQVSNTYKTVYGTSYSAPHVTGAIALMRQANRSLSPSQLKTILEDSAVDLGAQGKDNVYGAGFLDVYAATSAAANLPFCQKDLGYGGPGISLSFCGDDLTQTGSQSILKLEGAPRNVPFALLVSPSDMKPPFPFGNGSIVPNWSSPGMILLNGVTDNKGEYQFSLNGGPNNINTYYVQIAIISQQSVLMSNAIKLIFGQ